MANVVCVYFQIQIYTTFTLGSIVVAYRKVEINSRRTWLSRAIPVISIVANDSLVGSISVHSKRGVSKRVSSAWLSNSHTIRASSMLSYLVRNRVATMASSSRW